MQDLVEKFNKAFLRDDLQDFCYYKQQAGSIFTKKIGKFVNETTGTTETIWFTNDPIKMLGCGFTIKSSYSPTSASFKYLPSFVLQDYIGMLYIKGDDVIKQVFNGVTFEAPEYKVRAFVMIHPKTGFILYKMPVYYSDTKSRYANAFDSVKEAGFGMIKSYTKAPEIHLDVLTLCRVDSDCPPFNKAHIALCAIQYPCKETFDNFRNKGWWYK